MLHSLLFSISISLFDDCAERLLQGRRAFQNQDFTLAAQAFQSASTVCPPQQRPGILLDLAKAQMMGGQLPPADATLSRLLQSDPRNAAALKLRGDVAYLLGKLPEAERLLLEAASVVPGNPDPQYALGRLYYHQSRFGDAVARFQKVLELDPASYRAYDNLGLSYEALNQGARALESYQKSLALVHQDHPEYDTVYANFADFLYRQADFERSFQFSAEAAKRNPRSARNFFLAGRALAKLERWDLASKWLNQAIALDPGHAAASYQLSQVYRRQGRDAEADRALAVFQSITRRQTESGK
jgi:tetratricopeptide (TPR) repeat protein